MKLRYLLIACALALPGLGCAAGGYNDNSPSSGDAGFFFPDAGAGRGGSGGSGSGGHGVAGSGGASSSPDAGVFDGSPGAGGSGGAQGSGGSPGVFPDGGVADSAPGSDGNPTPPDANPIACQITLVAVSPTTFVDVPAGPAQHLVVEAQAFGYAVPEVPMWKWDITVSSGTPVWRIARGGDPRRIEIDIEKGPTSLLTYAVVASIEGVMPTCKSERRTITTIEPGRVRDDVWIRATPPPRPRGQELAPIEQSILVRSSTSGRPNTFAATFDDGYTLNIRPARGDTVLRPYFVRIAGHDVTTRFEAYVTDPVDPTFSVRLDDLHTYDLLIIPDTVPAIAPRALVGLSPALLNNRLADPFDFGFEDPGTEVTGTVSLEGGTAVRDARVRLRDGLLPSTVGTTDAQGRYTLLTRRGQFTAQITVPAESGLPDATAAAPIAVDGTGPIEASFTYKALPTVALKITVTAASGGPLQAPARVTVATDENELSDVGSFRLSNGVTLPALGALRASQLTTGGVASFAKLPRARYKVSVAPDKAQAGAALTTIAALDLRAGDAAATRTVALAAKAKIGGKLTAGAATPLVGLTVLAIDAEEDGLGSTVSGTVGADGTYTLSVDPDRNYRVFVEPPSDRRVPRVSLGYALAPEKGTFTIPDRLLPGRVPVTGKATTTNGMPLPGALIQVFCIGRAPDCVEAAAPSIDDARPVDETVSAADGSYTVYVRDPGTGQ